MQVPTSRVWPFPHIQALTVGVQPELGTILCSVVYVVVGSETPPAFMASAVKEHIEQQQCQRPSSAAVTTEL